MNIIVCIKQVPDSDNVRFNEKTGTLVRDSVTGILNPSDRSAVRKALRLAEAIKRQGQDTSVTVLTMGPAAAEAVLREGLAYGADEAVLLCDKIFAGGDTWATSLVLAAAVRKISQADVIVTGDKSTDGETGHVGPQIAEHLGWPQATMVREIFYDGRMKVERKNGTKIELLEVQLPAVISVLPEMEIEEYLAIGAVCDAFDKKLTVWDAEMLELSPELVGLMGSKTEVRRTFLPVSVRTCKMLSGTLDEMASALLERLG